MWNQETSEGIQTGRIPLGSVENRVLHALVNNATKGNLITKTQTALAAETLMKVQHFNKAMKHLYALGFWEKCPDKGKRNVLMISPHMGYKGDALLHDATKEKFDRWQEKARERHG